MHPAHDAAADFTARRDREQRRHYARQPKKIADVLAQLITARGYGRIQADRRLRRRLAARRRRAARHATAAPASSAAACSKSPSPTRPIMQELTFQKQHILADLQADTPRRQNPRPPLPRRHNQLTTKQFEPQRHRDTRVQGIDRQDSQNRQIAIRSSIADPVNSVMISRAFVVNQEHRSRTNQHGRRRTRTTNRRQPAVRTAATSYTAEDLEHLSDLEHVRERPGMYIGDTTRPRPAPPRLRSRRQLDRRSDGRPRHDRQRHDQRRRLGHRRRRRPRHPRRAARPALRRSWTATSPRSKA